MPKAQLYNDLHPDKSLKNTGFKDHNTAIKTIKMISKRSLRYQFDVINTMYNRAKYHPHINEDMKKKLADFLEANFTDHYFGDEYNIFFSANKLKE